MTLVIVCFCFCLFIFLKIFFIWGSFVFALSETHCSAVEHVVVTVVVVGVGESEAGFSVGGCAKFLRNSKALPGIFGEGLATSASFHQLPEAMSTVGLLGAGKSSQDPVTVYAFTAAGPLLLGGKAWLVPQ